jgi:hypothetical protein
VRQAPTILLDDLLEHSSTCIAPRCFCGTLLHSLDFVRCSRSTSMPLFISRIGSLANPPHSVWFVPCTGGEETLGTCSTWPLRLVPSGACREPHPLTLGSDPASRQTTPYPPHDGSAHRRKNLLVLFASVTPSSRSCCGPAAHPRRTRRPHLGSTTARCWWSIRECKRGAVRSASADRDGRRAVTGSSDVHRGPESEKVVVQQRLPSDQGITRCTSFSEITRLAREKLRCRSGGLND